MKKKLSITIIIETCTILLCFLFVGIDYFSNNNIFDLFIRFTPSEELLIEDINPNSQGKVQIFRIDNWAFQRMDIRVDYIPNPNSKVYSYNTSCLEWNEDINAYNMYGKSTFYHIEWNENVPHIQIVGHPNISIIVDEGEE